jgi:glutathione synthase/RimK-type ligase-like ATP-grasp enzyme
VSSEHKNILLTGGRALVTLDLVRQFASFGHHIIIAESVPIHLCRYSKHVKKSYLVPRPNSEPVAYIDALIDIIQAEKIDLVIPTCEDIFFIAKGLDRLRKHCTVFVAPLAQMKRLHSKWDFNQLARHYGFLVPETHLLTSQHDLQLFIARNRRPFVLKPVFSRFATKVLMVDVAEQTSHSFQHLTISEQYPWIAQEHIYGKAMCSYSIVHSGKLVAHAVYAETFTAGQGACIHFVPVENPEIERWIARFVEIEQFSGQIAFDFIVTNAGDIFPLECNPRATNGIHLFQKDDQLPEAFLAGHNHDQKVIKPKPSTQAMIAIAMLVYGLRAIHSWARLKEWIYLFFQAKDVIFDSQDMKPFLYQLFILWYNWKESRKLAISLQEFSTIDIEWNGQD